MGSEGLAWPNKGMEPRANSHEPLMPGSAQVGAGTHGSLAIAPNHAPRLQRSTTCLLGLQGGPIVNILEPQGFGKQSLLQGALNGAFDIVPHGTEPERVRVFP
jgi:hypothetical protein